MENNQPNTSHEGKQQKQENYTNQVPLPVHNPLDPNDKRKITQEDLDRMDQYKEAMTERD